MAFYSSPGRGRGRGRGRGGLFLRPFESPSAPGSSSRQGVDEAFIDEDLLEIIATFAVEDRESVDISFSDVEPLASYSWKAVGDSPTILVPDSPPIWKNAQVTTVKPDSGLMYRDQNAARMGSQSSLNPIFAAIDAMGQTDRLPDFDIITDRNNLRKLLRWAVRDLQNVDMERENFRIDVELSGATCLFTRREGSNTETITEFRGFGKNYSDAATRRASKHLTTGHHRCTSMMFGNVNILLRCEVDACTPQKDARDDLDDLTTSFGQLSHQKSQEDGGKQLYGLTVMPTPHIPLVPQSSIIEIKTRVSHREIDWAETLPQLTLSQTPLLYLAKHLKGRFGEVHIFDVASDPQIQVHEQASQKGMRRLQLVLREIMRRVRLEGEGVVMALVCKQGTLTLHKRKPGTGKLIDADVLRLFRAG